MNPRQQHCRRVFDQFSAATTADALMLPSEDFRIADSINRQSSTSNFYNPNIFLSGSTSMVNVDHILNKRSGRVFVNSLDDSTMVDSASTTRHVQDSGTFQSINDGDNNTNIYTEPTIFDSNENNETPILLPPNVNVNLPLPLEKNHDFRSNQFQMINHQQQHRPEALTIVGQDMAITLRQGQLTQTLLNSNNNEQSVAIDVTNTANNIVPNLSHLHLNPQQILHYYYSSHRVEFLPLCDLLFNIISLAAYFCDVVFDSVTAYTLFLNRQYSWLFVALFLILTSTIISQILSYNWYRKDLKQERDNLQKQLEQSQPESESFRFSNHLLMHPNRLKDGSSSILVIIHVLLCGVLWRYFKLFAPVNLMTVKREVSQLCILRMVHAFCQAGPMLLLQTYLVWRKPSLDLITDLNIISIFLSLFSICWALSSFNKNIRPEMIHKLVLTWFGVIFQFLWRIGTITSRIVALTVYAVLYEQWLFVVLILHWFSMFLWLLSPHMLQLDNGNPEQSSSTRTPQENDLKRKTKKRQRITGAAALAWIYIFCFVNMEDTKSRYRMLAFYATMFLENILLLSISMFFDNRLAKPWYRSLAIFLVLGSFLMGMFFMWIYYRFFHIRNLKNSTIINGCTSDQSYQTQAGNCSTAKDQISMKEKSILNQLLINQLQTFENKDFDPKLIPFANTISPMLNGQSSNDNTEENIPGVFNCRLNPALKRKKKKPSTIPPLPHLIVQEMNDNKTKSGFKNTLESISENVSFKNRSFQKNSLDSWKPGFQSKNLIHQIQRPLTNSSVLMRSYRQSPADSLWLTKANQSGRSLSISPATMLKSENAFRNCRTTSENPHQFSSTITSPNILQPTRNFTDKLDVVMDHTKPETTLDLNKKKIIRPKPIVQHSINLDSISEININIDAEKSSYGEIQNSTKDSSEQHGIYNFYEYLNSLEKPKKDDYEDFINKEGSNGDLFMHRRPPVPGRESGTKSKCENEDNNSSYMEGKKSLLNCANKISEQSNFSTSNSKIKQYGRNSTKKRYRKNKTRIKSNQKYRSRSMDSTASSTTDVSSKSDEHSSSGDDGDIESDVNHHNEMKSSNKFPTSNRKQIHQRIYESAIVDKQSTNLYDKINEDYDEAFGSEDGIDDHGVRLHPLSKDKKNFNSIYGQIDQQLINRCNQNNFGQDKYPSVSILKNPSNISFQSNGELNRPRTIFNGAKYKRYNTPL